MKPRHFRIAMALVGTAVCTFAQARSAALSLNYVPATKVQVTDTFWKPLLDRNRTVTIPHNLRMCREVGIVANFERVAGLRDDDYHGLPNWDDFLYKAIEAACYGLRQRPDPELEKELDDLIAVLARAQDADGYLRTVIQLSERGRGPVNLQRWSNLGDNLELYCAGHLFEAGAAEVEVGGAAWKLEQEGNYPWDGRVKLKLNTENPSAKLETIFVRIPGWARSEPVPGDLYRFADDAADAPALAVNGRSVELGTVVTNGFARLARAWRSGDVIELDLPMAVRRVVAHLDVKDCAGKVALQRGPIVYCFEGTDHDGRVLDLAMSGDAVFAPHLRDDLLGGTTVLEGELMRAGEPIRAIAIPYHLWSNRGAGEMTVWLDTVPPTRAETPVAPPGRFYTSWLGNTYMDNNGKKNVTEELNDICVSPNGHVFTAGYAETWGGGASYQATNGGFIARYDRFETGFGDPVSCVAADDRYVYFGSGKGILRARHGGSQGPYATFLPGTDIQGLFVTGGKVYVSDFGGGTLRVLNSTNMVEERNWPCPNPTRLTVDAAGNVWVVIYSTTSTQPPSGGPMWWGDKVRSFSPEGIPGPEITDFEKPLSVAVNRSGQLLVGGLNEHCQLWLYLYRLLLWDLLGWLH